MLQIASHPRWALAQLLAGQPEFKTMKPYIPNGLNMQHLGLFMDKTFSGRLTADKIKAIRDQWQGNLVIKGIVNPEDAEIAIGLGVDGLIVSNHGGRQLDSGESTIKPLTELAKKYSDTVTLMMDGGIRSGADIASTLASGAKFTFLGRAPMFGACAMGAEGGNQALEILKRQLQQIMEQVGCERIEDFPMHLIK
jgi:L-lactate dehydrogenase (cytochrome)